MKESRGAIVSVASIAGLQYAGSSLAYGASKAGVINITQNLARGLGPEVRVLAEVGAALRVTRRPSPGSKTIVCAEHARSTKSPW